MKWRKYKKLFKKKIEPKLIGTYIGTDAIGGCPMKVIGIKIKPAGRHKVTHEWEVEPMSKEMWEETRPKEYPISEHIKSKGYDISFEIPKPSNKDINKLFGW